MQCDHPFIQRNKATKTATGVGGGRVGLNKIPKIWLGNIGGLHNIGVLATFCQLWSNGAMA